MMKTAEECESNYDFGVKQFVNRNFYVDDGLNYEDRAKILKKVDLNFSDTPVQSSLGTKMNVYITLLFLLGNRLMAVESGRSDSTEQKCVDVKCGSGYSGVGRCLIPNAGVIISTKIWSQSCIQERSYGVKNNTIWTKWGCVATFHVCHSKEYVSTTTVTSTTTTSITTSTTFGAYISKPKSNVVETEIYNTGNTTISYHTETQGPVGETVGNGSSHMGSQEYDATNVVIPAVTVTLGLALIAVILVAIFICRRKSSNRCNTRRSIKGSANGSAVNYSLASGEVQFVQADDVYSTVNKNSNLHYTNIPERKESDSPGGVTVEYSVPHKSRLIDQINGGSSEHYSNLMPGNFNPGLGSSSPVGCVVMSNSTDTDSEYDKLHVFKPGHAIPLARVYDHANFNTDSSYDKLTVHPAPIKRTYN
ncbi:hypothetical protein ScPMuIL_013081 [Solemya velum]